MASSPADALRLRHVNGPTRARQSAFHFHALRRCPPRSVASPTFQGLTWFLMNPQSGKASAISCGRAGQLRSEWMNSESCTLLRGRNYQRDLITNAEERPQGPMQAGRRIFACEWASSQSGGVTPGNGPIRRRGRSSTCRSRHAAMRILQGEGTPQNVAGSVWSDSEATPLPCAGGLDELPADLHALLEGADQQCISGHPCQFQCAGLMSQRGLKGAAAQVESGDVVMQRR